MRLLGLLSATLLLLLVGLTTSAGPAAADHPPTMLGPGAAGVNGIGHEAVIRSSKHGPVYISGKHSSHLLVKYNKKRDWIHFRDFTTHRVNKMPKRLCDSKHVRRGISVVCRVPATFDHRRMFVQVWPRLGNDYVDGRTLPARFRLWVLTDAGRDVVHGGAGADFVNGAKGDDREFGGAGHDWLRGGPGHDRIHGGPGHDRIAKN